MIVSIESLKALREITGAGMMDCKKALMEAGGDQEAARVLIVEWGLATSAKRADRETREGRVGLAVASAVAGPPSAAGLAALACETDFVARNGYYVEAANAIASRVLEGRLSSPDSGVEGLVSEIALRMKENIVLKGIGFIEADAHECLDTYLHGEGSIAAALRIRAEDPACFRDPAIRALLHDLSLQVAARAPRFIGQSDVPPSLLDEKRHEFREELAADPKFAEKGEALLANVVEGKLRKFISTQCLLEQSFIKDEALGVGAFLATIQEQAGTALRVTGFLRLAIGEE
ncbi:translation elongation factor Ts [bacterium]|nr:translation elongation factor Ts [bacterium]